MNLIQFSTLPPESAEKESFEDELKHIRKELFDLQNVMYADGRYAMLIVLQGMDASGKDSTVRHVMSNMNPMGVRVKPFKKPSEEEMKHDFLWRVVPHFPEKGIIQVFNRSYYEDILVPGVYQLVDEAVLNQRYRLINEMEQHLVNSNIIVLKCFLHISRAEQEERFNERMEKPYKRWKYSADDRKTAQKWTEFQQAYQQVIQQCSTVPWHIIPADKKWYRDVVFGRLLVNQLKSLHLKYPG